MKYFRPLTLLSCLTLGACALGPDYSSPQLNEVAFSDITAAEVLDTNAGVITETAWWLRFDDPVLLALIERAAVFSTDIRRALYAVEEARAARDIARAARRPFLSGLTSGARQQSSETAGGFGPPPGVTSLQNLFDLNINLSWELDLFGRLKRSATAAQANLDASEEDRRAVMVAVFSEVGIAYAELRGLQAQYEIATRNIEIESQIAELTLLLAEQGLASEFDVVRANAERAETAARQNQLLAGQHSVVARLAFLSGQQSVQIAAQLLAAGPQLIPSARIPVGLPSEMLSQRTDIRAAERRLAAASEQVGIEQSDLLPRFSLTGIAGPRSANLEELFDAASQSWNVGGTLNWPIFEGGSQRAEIQIARSRLAMVGVDYDAVVLGALQEVETALGSYVYLVKELEGLTEAKTDRDRAYELALMRYRNNIDSLFPSLDAGRRLVALNSEIAVQQQELLIAEINVYRALGGGWQMFEKD